jgi:hypothetical protein
MKIFMRGREKVFFFCHENFFILTHKLGEKKILNKREKLFCVREMLKNFSPVRMASGRKMENKFS